MNKKNNNEQQSNRSWNSQRSNDTIRFLGEFRDSGIQYHCIELSQKRKLSHNLRRNRARQQHNSSRNNNISIITTQPDQINIIEIPQKL